MNRYKQLMSNFYSADLHFGKIELKPTHGFSCFFIVEHTDNKEFIKDQSIKLILSGCRNFYFFGVKEPIWHHDFDLTNVMLFPEATSENIVMTRGFNSIEEFVEELRYELLSRSFIPHDRYLFYDDVDVYKKVLSLLGLF